MPNFDKIQKSINKKKEEDNKPLDQKIYDLLIYEFKENKRAKCFEMIEKKILDINLDIKPDQVLYACADPDENEVLISKDINVLIRTCNEGAKKSLSLYTTIKLNPSWTQTKEQNERQVAERLGGQTKKLPVKFLIR